MSSERAKKNKEGPKQSEEEKKKKKMYRVPNGVDAG